MAGSYKKKVVNKSIPQSRVIAQTENPAQYYFEHPAWSFVNADQEMWAFTKDNIGDVFWTEILPRLKSLESQTWSEILVNAKKQNHSIDLHCLNKIAQNRLADRYIEAESIISLSFTGTHRLYGYMSGRVFHILWYDNNHGDNDTCVCRSHLKHT